METSNAKSKIISHDFPVWRSKANFIIRLLLKDPDIAQLANSEQIWARQIEKDVFEVCCIPFFAYGLALGDLVKTTIIDGDYIIDEVGEKGTYDLSHIIS
jgi:hypothetical protein